MKTRQSPAASTVLVISQLPPPFHGSTVMTATLIRALNEHGYDVRLVDRRFSRKVDEIGRVDLRKIFSGLGLMARVTVALLHHPTACIFFTTNRMPSFAVDVAISYILRAFRTPRVNYIHTSGYSALSNRGFPYSFMTKALLKPAILTVTLGSSLGSDLSQWVPASRIRIVANATSPVVDSGPQVQTGNGGVLFLSNLIPEKGAGDFIEAAAIVHRAHLGTTFTLAGAETSAAYTEELTARIGDLHLEDALTMTGAVQGDHKDALFGAAHLFVFPSRYPFEAQPLTIVEAMSHGLPVVAYDVGGIRDLIFDDVNGYLITPGDVSMLASRIREILEQPKLRRRLSVGARTVYLEQHHPRVYSDRWRNVLIELDSEQ